MSGARSSAFRFVEPEPEPVMHNGREATPAETLILLIEPELTRAEQTVAQLRALLDEQRRNLAKERGVAFIREEHVRKEFAGDGRQDR